MGLDLERRWGFVRRAAARVRAQQDSLAAAGLLPGEPR